MVEDVLIASGVMVLVFLITMCVAAFLVVRRVRRGYRTVRARLLAARASQPELRSVVRTSGSAAMASIGSPGWWAVQNRRHRMWKSVTSAEHAVSVARRADVPIGELPVLARRLRVAATGVDAVLRASSHQGSLRNQDRVECDQVVAAASDLRAAALSSLRSDAHTEIESLVSAVKIEVAAVAAGVSAAHG